MRAHTARARRTWQPRQGSRFGGNSQQSADMDAKRLRNPFFSRQRIANIVTRSGPQSTVYHLKIDLIRRWISATHPVVQ